MTKQRFCVVGALLLGVACSPANNTPSGSSGGRSGSNSAGSGGQAPAGSAGSSAGGSAGSGGNSSAAQGGSTGSATGGSGAGGSSAGSGGSPASTGGSAGSASGGRSGTDAATGSGGSSGADAAVDRPNASGPTCPAGTKFCDDFEAQMAGVAPTGNFKVNVAGGGSVTVVNTKFFSGKQALLIKGPAGSFTGQLTFGAPYLPVPSNDVHGRAMVFMTAVPGGGVHFDTAIGRGTLPGAGGSSSYILGGMYGNFMAVYHPGDCSVDSTTKYPAGRWACLQWEFKGATDGTHALRMMLDGKLVDKGDITTMGPANCVGGGAASREWKAPTFNSLAFGWVNYQSSSIPVEMWVDDLAFGEQAIPCPTAP